MRATARLALAVALAWATVAHAETRRVAVIVGNNAGNGGQAPLRYAEVDAGKISRVLVELGGVPPSDMFLLQGKDLAALEDTLRRATDKVAAYHEAGADRVVLFFYYSGHSDGVALELGRDRYAFASLRKWLKDTNADVRVGLVDSCKSGALLATKGGTPGPAFQIRLTDELSSSGEALLTSSAADENALESKEIGGSFFTHHLVSGLRGAADTSGDSRVTLTEAYQYAYKHTINTSGATLAGPQHPAYDYQLSGQGELILTELTQPSAALSLPDGFDRALVIESSRDQVIAELASGAPAQVAVLPGRYGVRAWKGEQIFEGRVVVAASSVRAVGWGELRAVSLASTRSKGGVEAAAPSSPRYALALAIGARRGVAEDIAALGGGRIGVQLGAASLSLDLATARSGVVRETTSLVLAGYRLETRFLGRGRAWLGAEAGGGFVVQTAGMTGVSGALAAGPFAGISAALGPSVGVVLELHLPAAVIKQDGAVTVSMLPAAWLGIVTSL